MRGTIKWYSEAKRFGWIAAQSGEEVYLHFSALRFDDATPPQEGDPVLFEILEGPGGKQAIRVQRPAGASAP
jgi:cold shock protein